MKQKNKLFVLITFIGLLFSCSEKPYYEKVVSFSNNKWSQRVKPSFAVDITDVNRTYNFTITLRTTTDYQYSNLWIYLNTKTPDGKTSREAFSIPVTKPDGTWAGIKTGTIVECPLQFLQRKLPLKGKYIFTIEQGITESKIDEVLDLGFRVE